MTDVSTTGQPAAAATMDAADVAAAGEAIVGAVGRAVSGHTGAATTAVTVVLAGGHLLVEDVPGVGKTLLAKALAQAIGATVSRVQFTPDLMPSDLSGVGIFNQEAREFEFRRGSLFAHIVLGDEINRASPKTQSAMLEAMEEGRVSVDGTTHDLPHPFVVIATQNPVEMEGTYPLPEAQRDRFMARLSLGYPAAEAEVAMIELQAAPLRGAHGPGTGPTMDTRAVPQVSDPQDVLSLRAVVAGTYLSPSVRRFVVDVVTGTRGRPELRLGASPRATLHLARAAQAHAALAGRDHVLPEDVVALAVPVLAHRVLLSPQARLEMRRPEDVVADVAAATPVPRVATP